ncbi:MAG: serine/threonine protein phosphatase [Methyloceanibacter sp.]|jgi:serine/threonine protein phosphatase 1|nr:serine/threonine protein phosphatase [Methyloceanibacter sp.]
MSLTYALPDIHGRYDLLLRALELIEERAGGEKAPVVFLGDYIDRGPQSCEVVELLMRGPPEWICLKGNHEAMMVDAFLPGHDRDLWISNGGKATLQSFFRHNRTLVQGTHLSWLYSLPLFHEDQHRIYIHAGIPNRDVPLEDQGEEALLWYRYSQNSDRGWNGKHVVHGHTPRTNGPVLLDNRTNLDCGAYFSNRLVVGVFDHDVPGGPVEVLEALSQ